MESEEQNRVGGGQGDAANTRQLASDPIRRSILIEQKVKAAFVMIHEPNGKTHQRCNAPGPGRDSLLEEGVADLKDVGPGQC